MKLSDKPCYPFVGKSSQNPNCEEEIFFEGNGGLTFRERLIIALASNPAICANVNIEEDISELNLVANADEIIQQADAIIKEMEK